MKGEAKIESYIDAVRELRALEQAQKDEPEVDRRYAIGQARVRVTQRMRVLTGGQIGAARRRLAEPVAP